MLTAIIFIIVISILIFVHEFGHFYTAKKAGMKVEEFGFGFPPRMFGWKRGETTYSINWIPFGGFVRIFGEDGGHRDDKRSFGGQPIRIRLGVVLAGVCMNILLAAVLLMIGNSVGLRTGIPDEANSAEYRNVQVQILQVAAKTPAENADLRTLDVIEGFVVSGVFEPTVKVSEVQNFVSSHGGEDVTIRILRAKDRTEKTVHLRADPPAGEGPLGISLARTAETSFVWYEAMWRGLQDTALLTVNTVYGYGLLFKTLLTHGKLLADVSGPIGIASLTGQAARTGINFFIQFVALISVNLAVLNVIPFPALDGGRALMLGIEKVKRSPVNPKVEGAINTVGFALLILLMIVVTFRDITKFF